MGTATTIQTLRCYRWGWLTEADSVLENLVLVFINVLGILNVFVFVFTHVLGIPNSNLNSASILTPCRRQDVLVLTPWLAPIVWEGTFSRDILNAQYLQRNLVTGLVTFAVEKYWFVIYFLANS